MSSETTEFFCDVAIIGAGFSGTMTAIHLLAENQPALSVALIEREDRFGQGVAYSTRETSHLLNVPAGKMSAFADRPSHFLDWLQAHEADWADAGLVNVEPSTFVPRCLYGKYVKEMVVLALGVFPPGDPPLNNGREVAKQIFTLGSALKGRLLETTAVPELRAQAKALAETILADFGAFRPLASAGELEPDPAYEI